MLPSWAHAYSHRMMKSYKCDTSTKPKANGEIRKTLNEKLLNSMERLHLQKTMNYRIPGLNYCIPGHKLHVPYGIRD